MCWLHANFCYDTCFDMISILDIYFDQISNYMILSICKVGYALVFLQTICNGRNFIELTLKDLVQGFIFQKTNNRITKAIKAPFKNGTGDK